jgi:hypothetical protein
VSISTAFTSAFKAPLPERKLQKMTHNEVMRLLIYGHHLRGNPDRDAPFIFFHPKGSGWTRNLDASTAREIIENKTVIEQTPEIYVLNQDSIDARPEDAFTKL